MLECLQKSLRIANSATEEIITVQLYCDTLDRYLYYMDRDAPAVRHPDIVSQVLNINPGLHRCLGHAKVRE